MLHDDVQPGKAPGQVFVDGKERALPVHDEIRRFAVYHQPDAQVLHQVQGILNVAKVADALLAVGGDALRVQLDADDTVLHRSQFAFGVGPHEQGHVGFEGQGFHDLPDFPNVSVQPDLVVHGRHQVGHDHASGEGLRAQRRNAPQHGAFAEVDVHVQGGMQGKGGVRHGMRGDSGVTPSAIKDRGRNQDPGPYIKGRGRRRAGPRFRRGPGRLRPRLQTVRPTPWISAGRIPAR